MAWWIYVVILVGILLIYFLTGFVMYLLELREKKKTFQELDKLIPYERDRLEIVLDTRDALENDGRHLPKNLTDAIAEDQDFFTQVPPSIEKAKGQTDFLILYLRKYLKEKGFLKQEKYQELDKKLEKNLFLDPSDKNSPYKKYNDHAYRYNAYLGMMTLALFNSNGKNPKAPIF